MRSLKKILASATAVALISSAFAGMTVQAEVGDVLMTQNFDGDTNWGEPSRGKTSSAYTSVSELDEVVKATMPATVDGNVMYFATNEGENVAAKFDMNPALSKSADVYGISFDMYIRNAGHIGGTTATDAEEAAKYVYIVGIGSAVGDLGGNATATNMFAFSVCGGDISIVANGAAIDTGIDTGVDGVWVTANLKADTTTKKINGTLTTVGGEKYTLAGVDFADTSATTISQLYMQSSRYDGGHKGHVDNYLDNFVVTEAAADKYADITINIVDTDGDQIRNSENDKGIVGNKYNVADSYKKSFEAEDTTMYYEYVSGADEITVAESGNEITLVYELKNKIEYKVSAKIADGGALIKDIGSGYVIPGETVKAFSDYAVVYNGAAYGSDIQETSYIPNGIDTDCAFEYLPITDAKAVKYDFEDGVDLFVEAKDADNEGHMTNAVVDSIADDVVPEGTKAVKLTSSGAGSSKIATAELNLATVTDGYKKVYVNFDSYISGGRMTANLLDTDISSYSDTGLFSIGIKDSGGYRINGTQSTGGGAWVHTSVAIDFGTKTLNYVTWDLQTGETIVKANKTITQDSLKSLAFISWSDTSAYVDNVEVIAADAIEPAAAYDFEDGDKAFTDGDHAATAVIDATDEVLNADINGEGAVKFTADSETGESKQAVSTIKFDTLGAEKITIIYDSYVASGNNVVFGVASGSVVKWNGSNVPFASGYRTANNNYIVNGATGSAYTGAAGTWVKTKVVFDAATGTLKYTITTPDGLTKYTSGTVATELTNIDRIVAVSWAKDSVGYIDNVKVYTTEPKTLDFASEDDAALFVTNDHATAYANESGNFVFTSDSSTGESKPATAKYDISAITAGKSNIVIKYKSKIASDLRTVIGVDDIFSQGFGKEAYYIINGATGSAYTGAADTWADTTLNIDLNAGTCTWTVGFETLTDDGTSNYNTASKTTYITANAVKAITITSTAADNSIMLDDVRVSAFGTYVESELWMCYEAVYNADGTLKSVSMTKAEDPSAVEIPENTETTKYFLWKGMTPYVAE